MKVSKVQNKVLKTLKEFQMMQGITVIEKVIEDVIQYKPFHFETLLFDYLNWYSKTKDVKWCYLAIAYIICYKTIVEKKRIWVVEDNHYGYNELYHNFNNLNYIIPDDTDGVEHCYDAIDVKTIYDNILRRVGNPNFHLVEGYKLDIYEYFWVFYDFIQTHRIVR